MSFIGPLSGSITNNGHNATQVVTGTLLVSGPSSYDGFISGAIHQTSAGASYLAAGSGISISSASNGQITITNDGTVGDITGVTAGAGLEGGGTSGNVTLAINSNVATLTGSNTFGGASNIFSNGVRVNENITVTGTGSFEGGISGSLTRLTDGTSYLAAGTNITITSASNGQVVINSSGGSGFAIGDAISGGTANRIIFEDSSNQVAEDAGLTYGGAAGAYGLSVADHIYITSSYKDTSGADPAIQIRANNSGGIIIDSSGSMTLNASGTVTNPTTIQNQSSTVGITGNQGVTITGTGAGGAALTDGVGTLGLIGGAVLLSSVSSLTANTSTSVAIDSTSTVGIAADNSTNNTTVNIGTSTATVKSIAIGESSNAGTGIIIAAGSTGLINVAQTVVPQADNTYDLGSAALRFANVYTGDLHLANDRGDWTVIEEAEYLSLRNNNTGKVYRLVMEEV